MALDGAKAMETPAVSAGKSGNTIFFGVPKPSMMNLTRKPPIDQTIHFSQKEVARLHAEFRRICDRSGKLSVDAFRDSLGVLGSVNDSLFSQRLFSVFNTSKTGAITFEEYVEGLGVLMKGSPDEKLGFAFQMADINSSGKISLDELMISVESISRIYSALMGTNPFVFAAKPTFNDAMALENAPDRATSAPKRKSSVGLSFLKPGELKDEHSRSQVSRKSKISDKNIVSNAASKDQRKIRRVFEKLDKDGDGLVSMAEYKEGLLRHPELMAALRFDQTAETPEMKMLNKQKRKVRCYRKLCSNLHVGMRHSVFLVDQIEEKINKEGNKSSEKTAWGLSGLISRHQNEEKGEEEVVKESVADDQTKPTESSVLKELIELKRCMVELEQALKKMSSEAFPSDAELSDFGFALKRTREDLERRRNKRTIFRSDSDNSENEVEMAFGATSDENEPLSLSPKAKNLPEKKGLELLSKDNSIPEDVEEVSDEVSISSHRKSKGGKTVFFGHKNWDMVINVMKGIQLAANRSSAEPFRPISLFDFSVKEKYTLARQKAKRKKVLMRRRGKRDFANQKQWRFVDYAPFVFKKVREHFGISNEDYIRSVGPGSMISNLMLGSLTSLAEQGSEGKSGSFFYVTSDNRFFIKTVHREEHKVIRHMLPQYFHHMTISSGDSPSLLTRIYGCHVLRSGKHSSFHKRAKIYLVVMNNVLQTNLRIDYRFDLKGSWTGRRSTEEQRSKHIVTLKDTDLIDLKYKINLGSEVASTILSVLERDSAFLEKMGLIDYSLLLGIHILKNPRKDDSEESFVKKNMIEHPSFLSSDGKYVYFLGVLDFLTPYGKRKVCERVLKTVQHLDADGISVQPPHRYAKRFMKFMRQRIV